MLIGLTGYAGVGKDTAAKHLVLERGFRRLALADNLRKLVYRSNHGVRILVDQEGGWDRAKRAHPYVRHALQEFGQAHRDVFGPDFWMDQILPTPGTRSAAAFMAGVHTVVSDVRYGNEVQRIRDLGGIVIRVVRSGIGPVNNHQSERMVSADLLVINPEGGVQGMYFQLDDIIKEIS